ncbi:hypothetical protein Q7P37_010960 [Cladosporium fusiforme]
MYALLSQWSLALAYHANGQLKQAKLLPEKVVGAQAKVMGNDHPHISSSQRSLALILQGNGDSRTAEQLLEEVVETQTKELGKGHPYALSSQRSLALACQANGQPKKATELLESVMATLAEDFGKLHPHVMSSLHTLASAYQESGQTEKAIRPMLLEQATVQDYALQTKALWSDGTCAPNLVNRTDLAKSSVLAKKQTPRPRLQSFQRLMATVLPKVPTHESKYDVDSTDDANDHINSIDILRTMRADIQA